MSTPPADDRDTLKALEILSAAAEPPARPGSAAAKAGATPPAPPGGAASARGGARPAPPANPAPPPAARVAPQTHPTPAAPEKNAPRASIGVPAGSPVTPPPLPAQAVPVAAVAPPAKSAVPPPKPAAAPPLRAAGARQPAPPALPSGPSVRCLRCGYRLLLESALRCSECGRQHTRSELDAWNSGVEQRRVEFVIWLVAAGLVIRLGMLAQLLGIVRLPLLGYVPVAAAAFSAWACYAAGQGRFGQPAGRYALGGLIAATIQVLLTLFEVGPGAVFANWTNALSIFTVDLLTAGCLLGAMSRPASVGDVWGAARGRSLATIGLILTLVFAVAYGGLFPILYVTGVATGASGWLATAPAYHLFGSVLPYAVLLGGWFFVWRWFVRLHRTLFAPRER